MFMTKVYLVTYERTIICTFFLKTKPWHMIRITKTHFHDQKNNHFQFRFPNKMKIRIRNMFLSLRLGKPTITHLNNRSTLDEMSRILFDQRDDPRPT